MMTLAPRYSVKIHIIQYVPQYWKLVTEFHGTAQIFGRFNEKLRNFHHTGPFLSVHRYYDFWLFSRIVENKNKWLDFPQIFQIHSPLFGQFLKWASPAHPSIAGNPVYKTLCSHSGCALHGMVYLEAFKILVCETCSAIMKHEFQLLYLCMIWPSLLTRTNLCSSFLYLSFMSSS